jgi:hypothetical protein
MKLRKLFILYSTHLVIYIIAIISLFVADGKKNLKNKNLKNKNLKNKN